MSENVLIDLTNFKDRSGARIPAGRYRVLVEDAEKDTSRAGNTMINLFLRVVDGEYAESTIMDRLTLTEKSLFRVVGFMNAIGIPTPRKRLQINLEQFKNKVLEIDVEDGEPFNGRVKSEVRGYIKLDRAAAASADLDDVGGLDEFPGGAASAESVDLSNVDL